MVFPGFIVFNPRRKSALRAILLALFAVAATMSFAGFPHIHALHGSPWQIASVILACWALGETFRCLRRRWSPYHAGIVLLLYSDLMILAMAMVFWLCL